MTLIIFRLLLHYPTLADADVSQMDPRDSSPGRCAQETLNQWNEVLLITISTKEY